MVTAARVVTKATMLSFLLASSLVAVFSQTSPLCPNYQTHSASVPTSVDALRVGDLKVVAAIGDSITAGMGAGALTIVTDIIEWRGLSFSGGGDDTYTDVLSLPNVLKTFTDTLEGASHGLSVKWPTPYPKTTALNVAVTGARGWQIPPQAEKLVGLVKADSNIDIANDWKHVSIFIGQNDLCSDVCDPTKTTAQPKNFAAAVEQALDTIKSNLPRTFVSLIMPVNVTELYPVGRLFCQTAHSILCKCGASDDAKVRQLVSDNAAQYWAELDRIARLDKYNDAQDFAVVVQPFMVDISVPVRQSGEADLSYFAPDCFHFSRKGHAAAAEALWNSLLEPVGSKRVDWVPGEGLNCPTEENPYLFTPRNSKGMGKHFKPAKSQVTDAEVLKHMVAKEAVWERRNNGAYTRAY